MTDEEYPVAKVPLYIVYCVAGDQNGNLILEAMIESIDKEVNKNKIKEEKVKRLKNQYKQKNLNEYQSIQRNSTKHIDRLGMNICCLDRRVNAIEGNSGRQHEVVMQMFGRQDTLLCQLLKQPYCVLSKRSIIWFHKPTLITTSL